VKFTDILIALTKNQISEPEMFRIFNVKKAREYVTSSGFGRPENLCYVYGGKDLHAHGVYEPYPEKLDELLESIKIDLYFMNDKFYAKEYMDRLFNTHQLFDVDLIQNSTLLVIRNRAKIYVMNNAVEKLAPILQQRQDMLDALSACRPKINGNPVHAHFTIAQYLLGSINDNPPPYSELPSASSDRLYFPDPASVSRVDPNGRSQIPIPAPRTSRKSDSQ
jgi:hypothetical protein